MIQAGRNQHEHIMESIEIFGRARRAVVKVPALERAADLRADIEQVSDLTLLSESEQAGVYIVASKDRRNT